MHQKKPTSVWIGFWIARATKSTFWCSSLGHRHRQVPRWPNAIAPNVCVSVNGESIALANLLHFCISVFWPFELVFFTHVSYFSLSFPWMNIRLENRFHSRASRNQFSLTVFFFAFSSLVPLVSMHFWFLRAFRQTTSSDFWHVSAFAQMEILWAKTWTYFIQRRADEQTHTLWFRICGNGTEKFMQKDCVGNLLVKITLK